MVGAAAAQMGTVEMSEAEEEERRGEARRGGEMCLDYALRSSMLDVGWEWQCPEARPDELIKSRETEREPWKSLFLVTFRGSGDGNLPKTQIRHWRRQALLA